MTLTHSEQAVLDGFIDPDVLAIETNEIETPGEHDGIKGLLAKGLLRREVRFVLTAAGRQTLRDRQGKPAIG